MKQEAEIFDHLQYLFTETGYNDHQLHCVIEFTNKLDAGVLKEAVNLLLKTVPVLSRRYRCHHGVFLWENSDSSKWKDFFSVVVNSNDFEQFLYSKTAVETGPQIKVCLYRAEKDSIAVVMNHMVTDGAGFKQTLYLLSKIYSNLVKKPQYQPEYIIDGDRSYQNILDGISFSHKLKILLMDNKDNNKNSDCKFPMSSRRIVSPFILTYDILPARYNKILNYSKQKNVTVNDILLTAYFRTLSIILKQESFDLQIMIDMRRYLKDKGVSSLTNLTSTVIISSTVSPLEDFDSTLFRVNRVMSGKKSNDFGLNTFVKLKLLYQISGSRLGYQILKKSLKNPYIAMTNIGILDTEKLHFENAVIKHAYICGSIKYRPHFQLAVSSFHNTMTFSVNLYGSREDREKIQEFFLLLDKELSAVSS